MKEHVVGKEGTVNIGATSDIHARRNQKYLEGYRGTMYYAATRNMHQKENKFLELHNTGAGRYPRHNIHTESNMPEEEGYVYCIQGQKRQ